MKKALKDHAPLPYANHITDIFIKFNVPIDDEPFEEINWRTGPIGAEVIHSFGFVKNQNGEWIHKRDMQDAPIHDDRTPSPPPQPTQDASTAMLNDIIHEIRDLPLQEISFSDKLIPTDIYPSVFAIYRRNYRWSPMINITDGLIRR